MIQVAFCSESGQYIDAHFASCPSFMIYAIGPDEYRPLRSVTCYQLGALNPTSDTEEDKVAQRIRMLQGCAMVYCTQIGGPAAARLVQNNIFPLKVSREMSIEEASATLSRLLQTNPPPWLRKRMV